MKPKPLVTDHRTQVYFPRELFAALKRKAAEEEVSIAELVRRAVAKELGREEGEERKKKAWQRFLKAAGLGRGPKDLARKHDKYFGA